MNTDKIVLPSHSKLIHINIVYFIINEMLKNENASNSYFKIVAKLSTITHCVKHFIHNTCTKYSSSLESYDIILSNTKQPRVKIAGKI